MSNRFTLLVMSVLVAGMLATAAPAGAAAPVMATGTTEPSWWDQAPENSERGSIHTDVNGDGRDDVVSFYSYVNVQTAIWVFLANAAGGFGAPVEVWNSGPMGWDLNRSRFVAGDYNGDGSSDIAALYDYTSSTARLLVFLANGSGGFSSPTVQWQSGFGNWDASRSRLVAGDFDGDGNDDIGAFYGYGNSSHTKLFTFRGTGDGGFHNPTVKWDSGAGNWELDLTRLVAGDFNNDGRGDIAAMYEYDGSETRIWVFLANTGGGVNAPAVGWDSGAGVWDASSSRIVAGDFDGDGNDDIGALYGYGNSSQTRLFTFAGTGTGDFQAPAVQWDSGAGNWDATRTRLVAGNFNGDSRTDIGAFYGWDNAQTNLFTFTGTPGELTPTLQWDSGPDTWNYHNAAPI